MATPINYGVSDQALAQAAAKSYAAQTGQSLDAMKNEFNTKVAELGASIVSGINPAERSVLEKQVQDLGNRYSQSLSATQGQYAFAQQQGQATNLAVQSELAKAQDTARALAAQSLGQAGAPTTGGMTSAQLDAINAARQTGAAQLAYLGGEAAVPAGMQISPGAGQLGVSGISALSQQLSQNALLASQARSRAELENSRTNLETSLQAQALSAAAAREEAQREQLRTFELQGFRDLMNTQQSYNAKAAELTAAAAASDSRSGQQKMLAQLELLRKQEAITLQNDLKKISAQNRASGSQISASEKQAIAIDNAYNVGLGTKFGQTLVGNINSIGGAYAIGKDGTLGTGTKSLFTPIRTGGNRNTVWTYNNGILSVYEQGLGQRNAPVDVDTENIKTGLLALVGGVQSLSPSVRMREFEKGFAQFDKYQKAALQIIYNTDKAGNASYYKTALNVNTK